MENFDKSYHDKTGDVLGALSYLSVFFAPVLFPLIVWIVGQPPASTYSRNALFNHILSWVCLVLGLISFAAGLSLIDSTNGVSVLVIGVIIGGILLIASLVLFIINIVKGIKLLMI